MAYASTSNLGNKHMNKHIALLLLAASSTSAIAIEPKPASEAPEGRVNFPSNFQVEQGWDLFVFGEYLYWIAKEDGLYYAHTGKGSGTADFPASGKSDFRGHLKKVDTEWDSAFRVGFGFNFPKQGLDIVAYWLKYSTDASNSAHSSSGTLFSMWGFPDSSGAQTQTFAKGRWDLDLNCIDLESGRSSWFGGSFSLRPFIGVRWLWIDQSLHNHYHYTTTPVSFGKLRSESDFMGGGVRAGGDARFVFGAGFHLYGIASGSLLYGEFNNNFSLKEDSVRIAHTKDHELKGISTLQLALGLGWETHFAKERCHLEFHLGWEQNAFFNVNQMNHYMQQLHNGDFFKERGNLSLQGAVAGGRFDF
ncbi:MAG: Lpg1974 family pore-forming outer membrane protein [Chlamydiota bacterium]